MNKKNIMDIVLVGLLTAVIVVTTFITIPMPSGVPITLQTFGVAVCGYILGVKRGTLSAIVYVALGTIGLPVFSGFSGGIGKLAGLTGGFIWGFILFALIVGLSKKWDNMFIKIGFGLVGLLVCDVCGALQYGLLSQIDFVSSFLLVAAPYLIKDIISVVAAMFFAKLLYKNKFCKEILQ